MGLSGPLLFSHDVGIIVLNFIFNEVQDLLEFLVQNMQGRLEFALRNSSKNTYLF